MQFHKNILINTIIENIIEIISLSLNGFLFINSWMNIDINMENNKIVPINPVLEKTFPLV